jgi:hypothetical protein
MLKHGGFSTPDGRKIEYDVLDTVELECNYGERSKYKKVIKKIQYRDDDEIAYIFCYYYWLPGKKHWHWTQRPLFASSDEIQKLLKIAEKKGFFKD